MTELRRVQSPMLNVRKRGALTVVIVLDPTDLVSTNLPPAAPNVDVRLHVRPAQDIEPGADFMRGADALIFQVSPQDEASCAQLERIVHAFAPQIPVIAAVRDVTLSDTRRLMRLGAIDVVPLPYSEDDLALALKHTRDTIAAADGHHGRHGKIIAFFKSAGGVGATALATQAGCLFAAQAARQSQQVCLIDFDVQFGNAADHLDLRPALSLADLLSAGTRLDGALLRSVVTQHASGLNVIAAPPEILPFEEVDADLASEILALATKEFDLVIVDLASTWTSWSLSLLSQVDAAYLVIEMGVPSLRQARRQLDLFASYGLGQLPLYVVVNRYERSWLKTISLDETEQALGRKVDFCIANDFRTVSNALDQGKMLAEIKASSRVQRDVSQMVNGISTHLGRSGK